MNDDELDRRLADYGATLERAATEAATARQPGAATVALDEVAGRRRRSLVWAAGTVAATAAAAIGVLALTTGDDPDRASSDDATTIVTAPPAASTSPLDTGFTTTTAAGSTSSTPVPSSSAAPTTSPLPTSTTPPTAGPAFVCDQAAVTGDTGVELAALMGDCHGGWALGVTPACAAVTEGECENAEAFAATAGGWRAVGPVYPFCVDPLVQVTGMTAHTAAAFGAQVCDPASSVDPEATPATLRPGDASSEVRALQIALIFEGYRITDDGTYGAATEAAVRDLQAREALPVDGIAGPATRVALEV